MHNNECSRLAINAVGKGFVEGIDSLDYATETKVFLL